MSLQLCSCNISVIPTDISNLAKTPTTRLTDAKNRTVISFVSRLQHCIFTVR